MIRQEISVSKEITLIVADRNHHVREFLQRELASEGYTVRTAESFRHVLRLAFHPDALDFLIMDPNLPDAEESGISEKLGNIARRVPIVIHTYLSDYNENQKICRETAFVEKKGNSVEKLKQVVAEILKARPLT